MGQPIPLRILRSMPAKLLRKDRPKFLELKEKKSQDIIAMEIIIGH
jgi:hypothetical protein